MYIFYFFYFFLNDIFNILLYFVITGKKLPPAPGCVDQKLTQLTTAASNGIIKHEELPQPISRDTPYALQKLLDMFRNQYLDALETLKFSPYKTNLESQITVEKKRKEELMLRKSQLEKQIAKLIEDSTLMLRAKLDELQIPIPGTYIFKF